MALSTYQKKIRAMGSVEKERLKKQMEVEAAQRRAEIAERPKIDITKPFSRKDYSKEQYEEVMKEVRFQTQKTEADVEKERIAAEGTPLEKQQEILERERLKREGVAPAITEAELPPEQLPPVTEPSVVEKDDESIAKDVWKLATGKDKFTDAEGKEIDLKLGELAIGPAGAAKLAINAAKVATSARALKVWKGFRAFIKTKMAKNLGKYGVIGYTYFTERNLSSIDAALSQVRESITLPVSLAAANPDRIADAWDMIEDYESDIREYESMVKIREKITPSAIVGGRTLPIYQRIKKLDTAIDLARAQIAKIEALGRVLTDEETSFALAEINNVLNNMEEPSKFAGII